MSNAKPLANDVRRSHYLAQNAAGSGKNALSSRQLRRLRRHDRKNLERIQEVAKATFRDEKPAPVEPEVPADVVSMRPCGGTDYCVTPSGAKAKATHKKCETV